MKNYYNKNFDCSRNQYRRITLKAKYQEYLDGNIEEYTLRRNKILNIRNDENE